MRGIAVLAIPAVTSPCLDESSNGIVQSLTMNILQDRGRSLGWASVPE